MCQVKIEKIISFDFWTSMADGIFEKSLHGGNSLEIQIDKKPTQTKPQKFPPPIMHYWPVSLVNIQTISIVYSVTIHTSRQ